MKYKINPIIIVNNDSMISNILDIRGKTIAYGDPASTSSHLIPRAHLLTNANLDIDDYKAVYLGSHDAVALNVQNGNADAGGLSKKIFEHLVEREMISLDKVKVIAISNPFPNYPWTMQSSWPTFWKWIWNFPSLTTTQRNHST